MKLWFFWNILHCLTSEQNIIDLPKSKDFSNLQLLKNSFIWIDIFFFITLTFKIKMPDHLGADQRKTKEDKDEDKPIQG